MGYKHYGLVKFFKNIDSEAKARDLIWKHRFGKEGFNCSECSHTKYYSFTTRPEVRRCKSCSKEQRLRAGSLFEKSHLPLLVWVRAIYLMMQGKRGISALELQRQLGLSRYETALHLLRKIRKGLMERDEQYDISGTIEFDGTGFGKRESNNQKTVIIGIETREYKDKKGKVKTKAGFAKVLVGNETIKNAQKLINEGLKKGSTLHTDGAMLYLSDLDNVTVKSKNTYGDPKILDGWQPWVHKFISNAKSWILGTHHGVRGEYLDLYLAEFTYRFNRRHDISNLFDRALAACSLAKPNPLSATTV